MTEEFKKSKKSRRRFLADMLFLGGGATAAALLAKSVGPSSPQQRQTPAPRYTPGLGTTNSPDTVEPMIHPDGEMLLPEGDVALPEQTEMVPEGGMTAPDCAEPVIKGKVAAPPQPERPTTRGRRIAPKHDPQIPSE